MADGESSISEAADAVEEANPLGPAVLWTCVAGCTGLAVWQLSEATLRARRLPRKERLGKLVSSGFLAVAYGSVALSFAGFAVGMRGDLGEPSWWAGPDHHGWACTSW